MRLCERIEAAVLACAQDENLEVLRSSAYLQEVGVVHSSREKARYSLQLVERFFGERFDPLDPRLVDCILNHVRPQIAQSAECRLMQICHKYVATHYLEYMLWKHHISDEKFERLQLERIEAYSRYLAAHPRGREIEAILQKLYLRVPGQ